MRSAVSRTAKGYSVEATLDMGVPAREDDHGEQDIDKVVTALSAFQITKLQEHMKALGDAFPLEKGVAL